jgi:hypothetical protein
MRPRERRETGEQDLFRSRLDQIIDMKHSRVKLARPAAGLLPFPGGKERRQARQPLLAAAQQIPRGERVDELLKALGFGASREGIATLLEVDALLPHAIGQPMMLIEADAGGERQVGTDANKHPSPLPVVDIEVVLDDPGWRFEDASGSPCCRRSRS